nr:hypothetical protein [Tanacetum cinerariifolium]
MESARDVYTKCIIIDVTKLQIVEWHNYKHLDWITVRRDDDKLYKFIEGNFNRLRIQVIKDMLLLLVQGKLTNLTVEECLAFNVSLRIFTRSIVIQRRVEDLQLRVESYQKKLNLTQPNTYRLDLKRREAYTAYSNPRCFIYLNKDKKNRLMRIDELHKFSDGTFNDVRTALNDRLKGIRIKYLPQTIWRQSDGDKAGAMIQDDDKLYRFIEGNFNRLHIQVIKDMLLLLVQGKLTNLTVEERLAFNVSLRIFTRSIVIQRRVEDLQLRVESDGTLNDVRTALNDRLKGIRIKYLPQTIWRQSDGDKAGAMIQSIDKQ